MDWLKNLINLFLSFFKKKQTKEAIQQEKLEEKSNLVKKEISELDKKISDNKVSNETKSLEEEINFWKKKE